MLSCSDPSVAILPRPTGAARLLWFRPNCSDPTRSKHPIRECADIGLGKLRAFNSRRRRRRRFSSLRSNPSIITAVMDTTSNWRDEVQPAFRQRFFNNILHNLQLGHPPESFDEILEFHKIAHSIEQKSYAGATSQAEYVMQIACKMVLMEKAREREWRDYFCPDSRQRIVYKIMKLLKRHLDVTDPEGSQELWRIAERFEEKIFSKADTEFIQTRRSIEAEVEDSSR
ncbi:hypothetical protein Ahy_A09g046423 isoform C [Arachis hypogaea]|uniref:Mediator complex subunit 15 KIX domain-containing protein n=1 Tax=Arachis hypogaea TaxID=3818 RepID=A0A445BPV1_ARAHY|nr:hypothetical protein Ahy_A09g046423 isoform C [Arachis hypogaea]